MIEYSFHFIDVGFFVSAEFWLPWLTAGYLFWAFTLIHQGIRYPASIYRLAKMNAFWQLLLVMVAIVVIWPVGLYMFLQTHLEDWIRPRWVVRRFGQQA